jgi:hypothetical protein
MNKEFFLRLQDNLAQIKKKKKFIYVYFMDILNVNVNKIYVFMLLLLFFLKNISRRKPIESQMMLCFFRSYVNM